MSGLGIRCGLRPIHAFFTYRLRRVAIEIALRYTRDAVPPSTNAMPNTPEISGPSPCPRCIAPVEQQRGDGPVCLGARMEAEEWRPIAGFEDSHSVSNMGRVRRERPPSRFLAESPECVKYARVRINHRGRVRQTLVHRLVAEAFIGPCPDGMQVNHINGDKRDNRASNLEYVTPSENVFHAIDVLGTFRSGERSPHARLKSDQVIEILARVKRGEKYAAIASRFGVTSWTVRDIVQGRTWRGVPR